jgi:Ser-tRNA(Ala) deacylase AlaX
MAALLANALPATVRIYLPDLAGNETYSSPATLLSINVSDVVDDTETETESESDSVDADLVFDTSPFHPQGGGQPTDIGVIKCGSTSVQVIKASFSFETSIVTHHCRFASRADAATLAAGAECDLQVDEAHRKLLSAYHSAGHLVDSAVYRLGYDELVPQKGYHFMDGPYVEYSNGKSVSEGDRKTLVDRLNEQFVSLIAEDIPTTICMMVKDDADAELNRTSKNFDFSTFTDPKVRIVGIAGFRCPCGGTHVRSSGELKDFEVTGIKMKKGDLRVKYGMKKNIQS